MKVIGADIEAGKSPLSVHSPTYSVVILNEKGEIIDKQESVSLSKLIRLTWEIKPDILALDNVFELAPDERKLVKVLSLMPDNMEIVQVTYVNGEFKDIREVAKTNGIEVQGKPTPLKTAYLAALLAIKGVGTPIRLKEKKTKIIISRGRALGPGGMSSNRYKRNIRGLILRTVKRIKEELDLHGFDYDYIVKRSKNGIESAVFTVYAPRESLYGIIKKMKGHDLRVEIRPVYKAKIEFGDSRKSLKPVIVGIDPGIEVGISVIDLYGNPVYLITRRNIDREDIIDIIRENGKPVLIATDVNPVPDTVKKVAAQLKCKLFIPEKSLSMDEKVDLTTKFSEAHGIKIDDPHIRDSLAAALRAYYEISHKLRQAEGALRRMDIEIDEDNILGCIINGGTVSECIEREIEKEINQINEQTTIIQKPQTSQQQIVDQSTLNDLKFQIEYLKRKIRQLMIEKLELEKRIEEIKIENNTQILKDRKIYEMQREIENYRKIINELKRDLEKERSEKEKIIQILNLLTKSELVVLKIKDLPSFIQLSNDEVSVLGEKINPIIFDFIGDEYIITSPTTLKDLEILYKEKLIAESEKLDLKRLFEEYRKQRFRKV